MIASLSRRLVMLGLLSACAPLGLSFRRDLVASYSPELARKVEPAAFPFVARYAQAGRRLVFVAAAHSFESDSPTFRQVAKAFDERPDIVLVEGFATEWGASPAPILAYLDDAAAGRASQPVSEALFAASLARTAGVPFLGGEPSEKELRGDLSALGFSRADIFGATAVKALPSAAADPDKLRCDDSGLQAFLRRTAGAVLGTAQAPEAELVSFDAWYRRTTGQQRCTDPDRDRRHDPAWPGLIGRVLTAEMHLRDLHLLQTIERLLAGHPRVLVVYGGSHWTTLSAALQRAMGRPDLRLS